jgi:hypothetical protein
VFKLEKKNISEKLKNKVMDYYEYTWQKTKNSKPITEFSIISASLQNDILFE